VTPKTGFDYLVVNLTAFTNHSKRLLLVLMQCGLLALSVEVHMEAVSFYLLDAIS